MCTNSEDLTPRPPPKPCQIKGMLANPEVPEVSLVFDTISGNNKKFLSNTDCFSDANKYINKFMSNFENKYYSNIPDISFVTDAEITVPNMKNSQSVFTRNEDCFNNNDNNIDKYPNMLVNDCKNNNSNLDMLSNLSERVTVHDERFHKIENLLANTVTKNEIGAMCQTFEKQLMSDDRNETNDFISKKDFYSLLQIYEDKMKSLENKIDYLTSIACCSDVGLNKEVQTGNNCGQYLSHCECNKNEQIPKFHRNIEFEPTSVKKSICRFSHPGYISHSTSESKCRLIMRPECIDRYPSCVSDSNYENRYHSSNCEGAVIKCPDHNTDYLASKNICNTVRGRSNEIGDFKCCDTPISNNYNIKNKHEDTRSNLPEVRNVRIPQRCNTEIITNESQSSQNRIHINEKCDIQSPCDCRPKTTSEECNNRGNNKCIKSTGQNREYKHLSKQYEHGNESYIRHMCNREHDDQVYHARKLVALNCNRNTENGSNRVDGNTTPSNYNKGQNQKSVFCQCDSQNTYPSCNGRNDIQSPCNSHPITAEESFSNTNQNSQYVYFSDQNEGYKNLSKQSVVSKESHNKYECSREHENEVLRTRKIVAENCNQNTENGSIQDESSAVPNSYNKEQNQKSVCIQSQCNYRSKTTAEESSNYPNRNDPYVHFTEQNEEYKDLSKPKELHNEHSNREDEARRTRKIVAENCNHNTESDSNRGESMVPVSFNKEQNQKSVCWKNDLQNTYPSCNESNDYINSAHNARTGILRRDVFKNSNENYNRQMHESNRNIISNVENEQRSNYTNYPIEQLPDADISHHMRSLAIKYASDGDFSFSTRRNQIIQSNNTEVTYAYNGNNVSIATLRYLERYQLLPQCQTSQPNNQTSCDLEYSVTSAENQKNLSAHQNDKGQVSKFLDITAIKQLPKLL